MKNEKVNVVGETDRSFLHFYDLSIETEKALESERQKEKESGFRFWLFVGRQISVGCVCCGIGGCGGL